MTGLLGPAIAPALHVMSFNVRRRLALTVPVDRWSRRRPVVQELLRAERPTLLGAQEVLPDQAADILAALGPSYRAVGHGREAGRRGEATPIFYDATRLELRAWDQRALSDTPAVDGSRSWGNVFPRVVVVARWRDLEAGDELRMLNTHLDPFSARSRTRAASAVGRLAARRDAPTVVTGDLNTSVTSADAGALLRPARLREAWAIAGRRLTPEWGTLTNYRTPRVGAERIDLLAVSPHLEVEAAAIPAPDDRQPSDHLPVQALVRVRPREGSRA